MHMRRTVKAAVPSYKRTLSKMHLLVLFEIQSLFNVQLKVVFGSVFH